MPNRWSHSRLALFENCPRAYLHKYVRNDAPTQDSQLRQDGKAFHRDAEEYATRCFLVPKPADLAIAEQVAARHLGTRDDLAAMLVQWAERHAEAGGFNWHHVMSDKHSVERWVDCELPNGDRFRGRLDLVLFDASQKTLIVRDYKSGWLVPEWDPENPPFQHMVYAYLGFKSWPSAEKCIAQCEYVRFAHEPIHEWELFPPLENVEQSIMERIGAITEWLASLETRDNRRRWHEDLSPGGHCSWCDYLLVCPVSRKKNFVPTDPESMMKAWHAQQGLGAKASAIRGVVGDVLDHSYAGALYAGDGTELLASHYPGYSQPGGFVPHWKPGMLIRGLQRGQKFGLDPTKLTTPAGIAKALGDCPEAALDESDDDGEYKFLVMKRASASLALRTVDVPNIQEPPEKTGPKPLEE